MTTVTALEIETGHTRAEVMEIVEEVAAQEGRAAAIVSEGYGDTEVTQRAALAVSALLHA